MYVCIYLSIYLCKSFRCYNIGYVSNFRFRKRKPKNLVTAFWWQHDLKSKFNVHNYLIGSSCCIRPLETSIVLSPVFFCKVGLSVIDMTNKRAGRITYKHDWWIFQWQPKVSSISHWFSNCHEFRSNGALGQKTTVIKCLLSMQQHTTDPIFVT